MTAVQRAAREAVKAGLSVVPPREDGSKSPDGSWKPFQAERPSPARLREWYGPRTGLGVICGAVSGNVECLEFDDREVYERFLELAHQADFDEVIRRLEKGYVEDSPSGGVHWLYRCETVGGNTKLATRPTRPDEQRDAHDRTKTLIETRGEGGYVIVAPSNGQVHPSGGAYRLRAGGFSTIPTLTPDERHDLFQLAHAFHEHPPNDNPPPTPTSAGRPPASSERGGRPGDDFNLRATWTDVLAPTGWTLVYTQHETAYWRRPGKQVGVSATTNRGGSDYLIVFSTNTAFETGRAYAKFSAYAILHHDGDFTAAAHRLAVLGFGVPTSEPMDVSTEVETGSADEVAAPNTPRMAHVVIQPGRLSEIVDQAEAALLASTAIFQRGGLLTRVVKLDATSEVDSSVRREMGSTVLIPVHEPWLGERMGLALPWYRVDRKGVLRPTDVPALYPRTLLSRAEWRFPVLRAVVTAPTLGRDGTIIEAPGFDRASGVLVDISHGRFPPMPLAPTLDDAVAALERLAAPLRGFPFVDAAARAVALAALLTALIRNSLHTAPLIGFDAPAAGTGKSLLAELAGLLATGFRPPALSQGKTAEEDEKRLATVLFAGDPVIHLDNCEHAVSGDFLCSMLTQEVVQARVLGQSERRILPCTALVLASGNNLTFAGDVSRRAVVCRLDCHQERPDSRAFDFDCHDEVIASRPELVVAGLTILRAYHLAGRPVGLPPMGSFTDWAWIRGALVWLGCADPADTRQGILENDPKKDDLMAVIDLWDRALDDDAVDVATIVARAESSQSARTLRDKLIEVSCRGDRWNSRSVGWWLRRHKDRVVGGRYIHADGDGRNGQMWRLRATSAGF